MKNNWCVKRLVILLSISPVKRDSEKRKKKKEKRKDVYGCLCLVDSSLVWELNTVLSMLLLPLLSPVSR